MEQHHVTPHWGYTLNCEGDHVTHRTCSCGEQWEVDSDRCPEDDGRHELVEATCRVWDLGRTVSPATTSGLMTRVAVDRVLNAVTADFDADERAYVLAHTERADHVGWWGA